MNRWLRAAMDDPYFQRRAFRERRRGDEARRKARLRRYWRTRGYDHLAERDRVPDPRECSCYLCRAGAMDHARFHRHKADAMWRDE